MEFEFNPVYDTPYYAQSRVMGTIRFNDDDLTRFAEWILTNVKEVTPHA
jgi:hypothetical protein